MFNLTKLLYNFVKMSGTYSGGVERERAAAEGGMVHIRNTNSTDLPDSTNQNKIGFLQTGCNIDIKIKNSLCSGYSVFLQLESVQRDRTKRLISIWCCRVGQIYFGDHRKC